MPLHPFLDWPAPIAFAHRGGSWDRPENTLEAFAGSVAAGYAYVETDAHATTDGVVMAFHDDRLDRVTDRGGLISALTAAEVETADAGHRFTGDHGRTHPFRGMGLRVPRLITLLESFPEVRINIDTKSDSVVEPLAALLRATNSLRRVCVGSFSDRRLARMRALCGDRLCTSMGPRATAVARVCSVSGRVPRQGAQCLQLPLRYARVPLVEPLLVGAAHRSGLAVHVWTVDEEPVMERLLALGVDGVMTDRPLLLREVLRRRGQWVELTGASVPVAKSSEQELMQ